MPKYVYLDTIQLAAATWIYQSACLSYSAVGTMASRIVSTNQAQTDHRSQYPPKRRESNKPRPRSAARHAPPTSCDDLVRSPACVLRECPPKQSVLRDT